MLDTLKLIEDNLCSVDVRYLGSGDILKDLKYFEANARIFDKESNIFANERILKQKLWGLNRFTIDWVV